MVSLTHNCQYSKNMKHNKTLKNVFTCSVFLTDGIVQKHISYLELILHHSKQTAISLHKHFIVHTPSHLIKLACVSTFRGLMGN